MPYTHLERLSACSVFCSRGHTATDTGVRHQVPSHNWSPSGIRLIFGRSSARRPYLQMPQWHPRVAKGSSIRPSARRPCPQVLQSHPGVAKGSSISSSARRPCLQMPQWHPRVAKGAFVKAKGAVLGNIKCDEEAACLQLGCRLSSLFL